MNTISLGLLIDFLESLAFCFFAISEWSIKPCLPSRCGSESLDDFAQHFVEQSLEELETIDVSSLANAFSRVSCRNRAFLQRLGDRLCADASSTLLPPVVTTMALNAFAVLKHCDRELFTVLVTHAVRKLGMISISLIKLGTSAYFAWIAGQRVPNVPRFLISQLPPNEPFP